jgi:hypothetical protein
VRLIFSAAFKGSRIIFAWIAIWMRTIEFTTFFAVGIYIARIT